MAGWLEKNKAYVALLFALPFVAGLVYLVANRPRPGPIRISTPVPTQTQVPVPTPTPAPLRVYVSGAVQRPDVYLLSPQSIVKDALIAAGGATADADLERINLAVQLVDQQQVYVPRKGEQAPPLTSPRDSVPFSSIVNINTATVEELDTLPGIGPAIAQRIVDYRTEYGDFANIEDLMNVKGIGEATFAKFKDVITVR